MDNVLVTNGSVSLEVLEQVLPYIDAMNIDLKGFREAYYRKLGGDFETVKAFIARAAGSCHVELTTLIVPGENDGPKEMEEEAEWIASINREIPLHVSRFFPLYRMKDRGGDGKEGSICPCRYCEEAFGKCICGKLLNIVFALFLL